MPFRRNHPKSPQPWMQKYYHWSINIIQTRSWSTVLHLLLPKQSSMSRSNPISHCHLQVGTMHVWMKKTLAAPFLAIAATTALMMIWNKTTCKQFLRCGKFETNSSMRRPRPKRNCNKPNNIWSRRKENKIAVRLPLSNIQNRPRIDNSVVDQMYYWYLVGLLICYSRMYSHPQLFDSGIMRMVCSWICCFHQTKCRWQDIPSDNDEIENRTPIILSQSTAFILSPYSFLHHSSFTIHHSFFHRYKSEISSFTNLSSNSPSASNRHSVLLPINW